MVLVTLPAHSPWQLHMSISQDRPVWAAQLRDVADFPRPGIMFKDINPLLAHPQARAQALTSLVAPWQQAGIDAVLGVEARGFILGTAMAMQMALPFVPVRKPGKLPGAVVSQHYALEYGSDCIQMQADALPAGSRVLIVDDVLATGGTLAAAVQLAHQLHLDVVGGAVLIELSALGGRARWPGGVPLHASLVV